MAKAGMSSLAAKLGEAGKKAFEEHRDAPVEIGSGGDCPPIPNGVAQLVDIHFDEYKTGKNQGKMFCYFGGTVITPKFVTNKDGDKIPSAGCRTQNTMPLCETTNTKGEKTSQSANIAAVQNEMKKLGADFKGLGIEHWETIAAELVKSAPFFSFNTTQSASTPAFPDPRVWHNWGQAIKDYESDIDPDAGIIESAPEPTKTETKKSATSTPAAKTTTAPAKGKKAAEPVEDVPFGDDLDMTADKAEKGDGPAMNFLKDLALKLGCSEDEVDNTADWGEVATLIRDKQEAGDSADADSPEIDYDALGEAADNGDQDSATQVTEWATENGIDVNDHPDKSWAEFVTFVSESLEVPAEEETIPAKGEVWDAVLVKGKKATSVEIVAVFPDKRTCNVKCLDTAKAFKGISFDVMTEAS